MDFIFISVLETGIWPILNYPEIKKLMTHLLLLLLRSYSTLVQTVLLNLRITWYTCWGGEGDHEGPAIGMPTKSSLYSSLLTHSAGAYPGFHSRSVITSPSMGCYQAFLTVSQYPCILLGGEGEALCEWSVLPKNTTCWPSLVSNPDLSTRSVPLTMRPVPQATHPIYFHLVALMRHGLIFKCFQTICLPDWMWQELGFWRCC